MNLSVVDRVCKALGADLCELFEYVPDEETTTETREGADVPIQDRGASERP